jgi:mannose/fructose-specific phosphotransferase system component IIA
MRRKLVLASHGGLATGMLDTLQMILGELPCEAETFSLLPGDSPSRIAEAVQKECAAQPDTEFLLVTDVFGASVCTALCGLVAESNVRLFAGMSLPMVLSLLTETSCPISDEEVEEALSVAREGARAIGVRQLESQEEEDF